MLNTVKWSIASTMINGVVTAARNAVSHIENLNKSLTNIQIVTGKSSNEMAYMAK